MGPVGPKGADGSDGRNGITKTVIVHHYEDGTVTSEEVPGLPRTGGNDETWWIALAALGLVAVGGTAAAWARKYERRGRK